MPADLFSPILSFKRLSRTQWSIRTEQDEVMANNLPAPAAAAAVQQAAAPSSSSQGNEISVAQRPSSPSSLSSLMSSSHDPNTPVAENWCYTQVNEICLNKTWKIVSSFR